MFTLGDDASSYRSASLAIYLDSALRSEMEPTEDAMHIGDRCDSTRGKDLEAPQSCEH